MGPTLVVYQSTGHGDLYAQTIGGGLVGKCGWGKRVWVGIEVVVWAYVYNLIHFYMWGRQWTKNEWL